VCLLDGSHGVPSRAARAGCTTSCASIPRHPFRRNVPELRDVPDEYLTEPWTMPNGAQREAGCVIGEDYPAPIVDHSVARREALARYGEAARA